MFILQHHRDGLLLVSRELWCAITPLSSCPLRQLPAPQTAPLLSSPVVARHLHSPPRSFFFLDCSLSATARGTSSGTPSPDFTAPQPTHSAHPLNDASSRHLDLPMERLALFEACLHKSIAPSSRPLQPLVVLPPSEWRAHTRALFERTAPARSLPQHSYSGYAGPWLENAFIEAVLQDADPEDSEDAVSALEDIFYPAVPLLAQWTDNAVVGNTLASPPSDITTMLRNVFVHELRPDVLYVAVTQHDHGEPGLNLTCAAYANVLLLSAGGWGNVVLPLIKGQVPHKSTFPGGKIEDPRSAFFTFVGSEWMGRDAALNLFRASALLPWESGFLLPSTRHCGKRLSQGRCLLWRRAGMAALLFGSTRPSSMALCLSFFMRRMAGKATPGRPTRTLARTSLPCPGAASRQSPLPKERCGGQGAWGLPSPTKKSPPFSALHAILWQQALLGAGATCACCPWASTAQDQGRRVRVEALNGRQLSPP